MSISFYGDAAGARRRFAGRPERGAVALIGANGAGKSSLFAPSRGWRYRAPGDHVPRPDITGTDSHVTASLGIGQVAEGRQIFPSLTVQENLEVGALLSRARGTRSSRCRRCSRCFRVSPSGGGNRRHDVRRRAADARHRPLPDVPARADPVRRAVAGACAARGAGGVSRDPDAQRGQAHHGAAGGAERRGIPEARQTRSTCSRTGASSCRDAARTCFTTTASARPTSVFSLFLERARGGSRDRCRASIPSRSAPSAAPSR